MMRSILLLAVLVACACATSVSIATRNAHYKWITGDQAHPEDQISFKVLLQQQNLAELERIFWEVSDPRQASYGEFLTSEEVANLVAPKRESVLRVVNWLVSNGVRKSDLHLSPDFITVSTNVGTASTLFNTQFSHYVSRVTGAKRTRIVGDAHIPEELTDDIDFVVGLSELIDATETRKKPVASKERSNDASYAFDGYITPDVLREYYNIPSNVSAGNATQAIGAFSDFFSVGALNAFDSTFEIVPTATITIVGVDCLNESCDQYESDLDVQYITSIGLGVQTSFLAHSEPGAWVLDWAQDVATMQNPPLVHSLSYGWPETAQCEITSSCQTLGYNSQQYVERTDAELQKLGSMGLTVLVSSGDDGAPSYYGSVGNCPMSPDIYCPAGGCNHTSTQCAELTAVFPANDSVCFIPMALEASNACMNYLNDNAFLPSLQSYLEQFTGCEFAFDTDNNGDNQFYSSCPCSTLTTDEINGFIFSAYSFDPHNGPVFTAEYPTSSPYVTSVSATQFTWSSNTTVSGEIAASIQTGAKITTGGGFSSFQAQPDYQSAAVNAYLKSGVTLPPSWAYNTSNRAYPDIAFNGHNFIIFFSNNSADLDQCPCLELPVDGTSASSPSLAGMLSLINGQLLAAGKSALGFLNTALYQMADESPSAFNDVTDGNNACNRAYCCEYGWSCTSGWDPVTGLGTPNYPNFEAFFLNAKGVTKN